MKIDDFMNQAESYNTDSETITGYFNIDSKNAEKNIKKIMKSAVTEEKKSDVVLTIDALTESKIEAIVFTLLAISHLNDLKDDKSFVPKVALAMTMCNQDGLISDENVVKALSIFAKIFKD